MKIRIKLAGGIPLRSLRITEIRDILDADIVEDSWQDTWPLEDLLHDVYSRQFENTFDVLASGLQYLQKSPVGNSLILEAIAGGWELGLSDLGENAFHIDVPLKKIILNNSGMSPDALMRSPYFRNLLLMTLIRSLRDIWHEKRQGGFDEKFGPEGILMLERVRAADCDVITTLTAWELRQAGEGELWRHVLASDEGDLAIAFGCTLEKEALSYPLHKAMGAAFDQWYRVKERAMLCDHESLEYIDQVIASGAALYTKRATALDVEILSCLPDKTAYLQGMGNTILTQPLYAGLHDEVNQTHYMQIVHDLSVTYVQGVPFRDARLASRIFPDGDFTPDTVEISS